MISRIYNKLRRITSNQLYFPEIDGIRFLAISLVVLFHIHGYFSAKTGNLYPEHPHAYFSLHKFLTNGDRGVQLFFVLSGFILCLPFAHYYINDGKKVSLKKYYLRRVTRLEPPYFIALTGIFIMSIIMKPSVDMLPHWLASLIYAHDLIYHATPALTVVAWSLEVEIQFYIFAPLFFRLLALGKITRRTALAAIILSLIFLQRFYPPTFLSLYGFAQYFLAGILLADFYVSNVAADLFNKKWMILIAIACLSLILSIPLEGEDISPDTLLRSHLILPFLICVLYYAILKNDLLKKIFSYKFIPIIGGMCYSIYLLHYSIISLIGRFTLKFRLPGHYLPNLFLQVVLLSIPIIVISSIFYYYIERPFMSSKWLDMLLPKKKTADKE